MGIFRIRCVDVDIVDNVHVDICVGDLIRVRYVGDGGVPKFLDGAWLTVVGFTAVEKVIATERKNMESGFRRLVPTRHITEVRKNKK